MAKWLGRRLRKRLLPGLAEPGSVRAAEPTASDSVDSLYSAVAKNRLDAQFHAIELIDARSSTLFTIGSTILPVTAGLLTTGNGELRMSTVALIALFFGFVFYLLLTTFFVWSYRINEWDSRPDPAQWSEVSANRSAHELHRWLGDAYIQSYRNNEPFVERKADKVGAAVWCLAGEAMCLTVAVLSPFWLTW